MFDCGVREKTVLEELESLDLDQHDREKNVKKYRDEEARRKEEVYREMSSLRRELEEKDNIIKGLAGYIGKMQ